MLGLFFVLFFNKGHLNLLIYLTVTENKILDTKVQMAALITLQSIFTYTVIFISFVDTWFIL